jgi:hypothetical protein
MWQTIPDFLASGFIAENEFPQLMVAAEAVKETISLTAFFNFFQSSSPLMIGLSIPKIQHQPAAEIQVLEKHGGVITKYFQSDGFVVADGL